MSGVYFIRDHSTDLIKIGVSRRPHARMKALATAAAGGLSPLGAIAGDRHLEKRIHDDLKEHRVRREWFRPTREVLDYIDTLQRENGRVESDAPLSQFSDEFSIQASFWVSALVRREISSTDKADEGRALDRVASRIGIASGLAYNLHYKRILQISASDFHKIRNHYIDDIAKRTQDLIEQANLTLDIMLYRDPSVRRLEAVIAEAAALLSEMTGEAR